MKNALMTLAALMIAAPALAQDAAPQSAPKPQSCVSLIQIDRSQVLDDKTILFHMKGGKIFKNSLPYRCPQLGFEKSFIYKTSINQLCSTDIITVFISGAGGRTGASCGLGQFVPYTPPPKAEKPK